MKKLSASLHEVTCMLAPCAEASRKMMRAMHVKELWKDVVMKVYAGGAHYILSSTNAVYIMHEHGYKVLIVYSSDSMVRDSLCNMQEFIKHEFKQRDEVVDEFRILPSRHTMRQRHPYQDGYDQDMQQMRDEKMRANLHTTKLSTHQRKIIEETSCIIEDQSLRKSFSQAMEVSFKAQNQAAR